MAKFLVLNISYNLTLSATSDLSSVAHGVWRALSAEQLVELYFVPDEALAVVDGAGSLRRPIAIRSDCSHHVSAFYTLILCTGNTFIVD